MLTRKLYEHFCIYFITTFLLIVRENRKPVYSFVSLYTQKMIRIFSL